MRGLAANVWGLGVTLVIQLVSVPALLWAWGVPTYGEWLILSALPTYLTLSDLSFSSVAGNRMVMLVAKGNRTDAAALGHRLWSIVTVMTVVAVFIAIMVAFFFAGAFSSGAAIPASQARIVLVALLLQVAVGNQYGVLDAWYRAGGRYPVGTVLRGLGQLLAFGALTVAALLGAPPSTAALALLAGSAAGFGVSWLALRRAVPWSTFRLERPHVQTFRELVAPGLAFMAFPIGSALSLQGFTIMIGATMGAPAVVIFSTTRTITRVAANATASITNSIWPELSRSVGSGRFGEARMILRRSVQLSLVVSMTLMLGLALFGIAIIRWWTHGLVDPPLLLLLLLLVAIVANSMWSTLSAVLSATNRHMRMAVVYLMGTTAALLGAVPLSQAYSLPGAAAALLAIDVAMVVYVFPASLTVVLDAPRGFFRAVLDVRGAVRSMVSSLRSAL